MSGSLNDWSKKAAMNLLSSGGEIIQLPEAESFYVARSKHSDMLCIGRMYIEGVDILFFKRSNYKVGDLLNKTHFC
jgi:hypothetical protein